MSVKMSLFDDLIEELIEDISNELQEDDDNFSETLLSSKVKNAVREVKNLRGYTDQSDEWILDDMENLYAKIRGRAIYAYNQIGAEGETSHSEKNITRNYANVDELYPIIKISKVV